MSFRADLRLPIDIYPPFFAAVFRYAFRHAALPATPWR